MEYKIKIIIPSLQDMTQIKIVTSLWNESSIIHDIFFHSDLSPTSDRVRANIQRLDLPLSLRSRLEGIRSPIMEQINKWLMSDYASDYRSPKYLHLFCWTSQGILDTKRTVMGLLRNEKISVFDRFRMACRCCLETEIHSLWERIDKNEISPLQIQLQLSNEICKFWTFKMDPHIGRYPHDRQQNCHPRTSNYLCILQEAVVDRNFPAVKYFFPRLAIEEKKKFSSDFSSNVFKVRDYTSVDICNFLFSSMDQEYQNELLSKYCYKVLFMFHDWPWQNHFLEYSKHCWEFLSLQEFQKLLEIILRRQNYSRESSKYYYDGLFEEFWMQSPMSFRRFMVNNDYFDLFSYLDEADEHKISLFLEPTSVEERKRIIFSDYDGMRICWHYFSRKRWLLSGRFLAECLPTAELVANFRKDFTEFLLKYFKIDKRRILKVADVIFDSLLKKRSEEENDGSENH